MKKYIFFLFLLFISSHSFSQSNDVRTLETKVADLLMKLPVDNSPELNSLLSELSDLGVPAVNNITVKIVPPGKGNDVAARYALSSLAKYLGKNKNTTHVKNSAVAFCNAIDKTTDNEVKDFLLQELQYFAGDESVPFLKKYLQNQRLADPAARVLVRINTPLAHNTLLQALPKASGLQRIALVNALGQTKNTKAAQPITKLAATNDPELKKIALYALAEIASPSSARLLKAEAVKNNFSFEKTDATGAYLQFLKNLSDKGSHGVVAAAAKEIINRNNVPQNIQSNAMYLLARSSETAAIPVLLNALKSPDEKYVSSAVALLGEKYTNNQVASALKTALPSASPFLQAQIINLLADKKDPSAIPLLIQLLNSPDNNVQNAAIFALAKNGGDNAILPLLNILHTKAASTAKDALLMINSNNVANEAAKKLSSASNAEKIALLEILAAKNATTHSKLVFNEINNRDAEVRLAAAKALANVVTPGNTNEVAGLLASSDNDNEISFLQNALFQALDSKAKKADNVNTVLSFINKYPSASHKFYNVLGLIGGNEGLRIVQQQYNTANAQQKNAAFQSLINWRDDKALTALYEIAKNKTDNNAAAALKSFISSINRSSNPADQKVLMFRNAMTLASAVADKRNILKGISSNKTLPALVFVAQFLEDADLQQNAVQAVNSLFLGQQDFYGDVVNTIVNQAIALNKDPEAEYQKQALLKHMASLPDEKGFVSMFNGKDLEGWKGLVENPIARAKMSTQELAQKQKKADEQMRRDWRVENGLLVFEGKGYNNLVSEKMYEDFEMFVDWKMEPEGDGGVYLRGSPQVQTWDTTRTDVGAQVGSGGLYNNQVYKSTPLVVADNPINEWNTFRIKMIGDKVTVYLNGILVTDNVILENYWDRKLPIFEKEAIELQAHGTRLEFRDVYVREIPRPKPYVLSEEEKREGFVPLFNGINLDGWTGNKINYYAENGMIVSNPSNQVAKDATRNLYTEKEYSDFIMRFEFQLTPGANNGLGIRTPTTGDAAYEGMELQILDNDAPIYKDLKPYQFHGSVYGVIPALRGYLKPVGEWNEQEVKAIGNRITITLNGKVILDGDIAEASKNNTETIDGKKHPGLLNKSGHIGFLGHGSPLNFRNIMIKDLSK